MNRFRFRTLLALTVLAIGMLPHLLPAQQSGGIVSGLVKDRSGAVVPRADVTVRNQDTSAVISLVTNGEGAYSTPNLPVGLYSITVKAKGFRSEERTDIPIDVDSKAIVDYSLQPGSVDVAIEVSTDLQQLNLADATIGTVVNEKTIEDMPVNGRSVLALTELSPGVHINAGPVNEGFADRGTALAAVSINNAPNGMNANLIDGQNNVQTYTNEVMLNPTADAISQFKIQTGTLSAEYGFTAGGVINLASRAGTDRYHGSLYDFFRNDILNARNYFVNAPLAVPMLRYNQFGGSLGGPVLKQKLQFFANYEGYQYTASNSSIATVPTPAQRMGDFSSTYQLVTSGGTQSCSTTPVPIYDPTTTTSSGSRTQYPGNIIPSSKLDPVALNIQNFYPLPNITPTGLNACTQSNNYQVLSPNKRAMRQALGRLDYALTTRQHLIGRYGYYYNYTNNGGSIYTKPFPVVGTRNDNFLNQLALLQHTFIVNSYLVNELRLQLGRTDFSFTVASAKGDWPQKLGLPSIVPATTFPIINGNGTPGFQTGTVGFRAATTPAVSDVATILLGRHSTRVGFEWRINRGSNLQTSAPSGSYNFSSVLTGNPRGLTGTGTPYASFLAGAVSSATEVLSLGETERNYSLTGFINDQWRVGSRVSLNLGIRYDFQFQPQEMDRGVSNFNPNQTNPLNGFKGAMQYAGFDGAPTVFQNSNYNNIAPRVGIAWDAYGTGKTSFRAGYGIYYPSIFGTPFFGNTQGFSATTTSYASVGTNQPAFYLKVGFPSTPTQPLGAALGPSAFLGQTVSTDLSHAPTPMAQQWNASVDQVLPGKIVLALGYAGNHGVHFIGGNINLNQLDPKYLSLGSQLASLVPNPYAGRVPGALGNPMVSLQQTLLAYPYYSQVIERFPHNGNYIGHAMLLSATRRAGDTLTLTASYTWSKLIDSAIQSPLNFGAVTQAGVVSYQNSYDIRGERGVDPLDLAHFFKSSVVWTLPFGRKQRFAANISRAEDALIGGWQVNLLETIHDGLPLTIGGANNNAAIRPNFVPGVSTRVANPGPGAWFNTAAFQNPPIYTFGTVRRTITAPRGPSVFVTNFSLFKAVPISERVTGQLRMECFNLFNHPNFNLPNMTFVPGATGFSSSSTFGRITSASDPRVYQLALKLSF